MRRRVNVASWPTSTEPTSASSTETCSSIFLRSSASVNNTGACSEAATVWPGSTERTSTTPLIGERMSVLPRSVLTASRLARACATAASRPQTLAFGTRDRWLRRRPYPAATAACCRSARGPSADARSSRELPSPRRQLCRTRASADASELCACSTCASSRDVSSTASTSPAFTSSFTSTLTLRTVPDSSLPISTWLRGSRLPVAVTVTVSSPRVTSCVT